MHLPILQTEFFKILGGIKLKTQTLHLQVVLLWILTWGFFFYPCSEWKENADEINVTFGVL